MTDLTFTRSQELDVTQIEGNTDEGIEFVDAWPYPQNVEEMQVIDAGRIIIPTWYVETIEKAAKENGLTVEHDTLDT